MRYIVLAGVGLAVGLLSKQAANFTEPVFGYIGQTYDAAANWTRYDYSAMAGSVVAFVLGIRLFVSAARRGIMAFAGGLRVINWITGKVNKTAAEAARLLDDAGSPLYEHGRASLFIGPNPKLRKAVVKQARRNGFKVMPGFDSDYVQLRS